VLEQLIQMLRDDEWRLEGRDRARILDALAYFVDPEDLIPDRLPGIGYLDDAIMVELISVHDPPSLASTGLHHIAFFVPDFDAAAEELTARGWPRAVSAVAGSNRFALHDAREEMGHLVEIYEPTDALLGFYSMVADAAAAT